MSKKKYRIVKQDIDEYRIDEEEVYTKTFLFIPIGEVRRWVGVEVQYTEQDAFAAVRRLMRYENSEVIWQSDVDDALEDAINE